MAKTRLLVLIAFVCVALAAPGAFARSWFDTKPQSDQAQRVRQYGLQYEKAMKAPDDAENASTAGRLEMPRQSLGYVSPTVGSPGIIVDNSWNDWQYTYAQHHVEWRGKPAIQFSYVDRQAGDLGTDKFGYNVYNPTAGDWPRGQGAGCELQLGTDVGLYPNLDVRSNGRVVMAGHQTTFGAGTLNDNVTFYQPSTAFSCSFGMSVIDSSQYKTGMLNYNPSTARLYQIMIELQENGSDTITHLVGQQGGQSVPLTSQGCPTCSVVTLQYFRKLTFSSAASWVGPTTLDTVDRMAGLCASRMSPNVAVVYLKYTAIGISHDNASDLAVYYRESTDKGATWNPKVNITPYNRVTGPSYTPWVEAKGLYDTNGKLHIVFAGIPVGKDPYATLPGSTLWGGNWGYLQTGSSVLHWSNTTNAISRIYNAEWDTAFVGPGGTLCGWGGYNMLSTGMYCISECNGHLYVVWEMTNNPDANPPLLTDCASGGVFSRGFYGNGELYMSVSSDLDGLLWDKWRDLTNTPTPKCDSATGNGVCLSDVKPSMSRYGMNVAALNDGGPVAGIWPDTGVNPGPGPYTDTWYLHLFYEEDHYPGQKVLEIPSVAPQGIWTNNPLKWMRLACVAPISAPAIAYTPIALGYAAKDWTHHGKPDTTIVTVTNDGNAQLNVSFIGFTKTTQTGIDWLAVTAPSLTVNAGISNTGTFGIIVNKAGIINSPGTIVALSGEIGMKTNVGAPKDTLTIKITNFLVADTLVDLKWDTVSTGCTRLIVSNNGDIGRLGAGSVNMDYTGPGGGECVTTGGSSVYAYDGGPIVIRKSGTTYIYSSALFQGTFVTEQAFKPFAQGTGAGTITDTKFDGFYSGTFVNKDTTIGVRRTYYAPTVGTDTCNVVIQKSQFFGIGGAKTNVTLGEVVDWDIPSLPGNKDSGKVLVSKSIVYEQGSDTSTSLLLCQRHNNRYGAIAFLGMYTPAQHLADTCFNDVGFYGAYTMLNDTLFKYDTISNTREGAYFWNQMSALSGLSAAPFQGKDLHMVVTYKHDIPSLDTLTAYTALVSVKSGDTTALKAGVDKAKKWYLGNIRHCPTGNCCTATSADGLTGNVDNDVDKLVDISDLIALVNYLYVAPFTQPFCLLACNIDGDVDNLVDISDLIALVNYLYVAPFPATKPCPQ